MSRPAPAAWALALLLAGAGSAVLLEQSRRQAQDAFDTQGRIMHRLLSQQVVQNDAVLATLALLSPASDADAAAQRLPALYPQLLGVQQRPPAAEAPDAAWGPLEAQSRSERRAVADLDGFADGRYRLLLAGPDGAHALRLSLQRLVPADDWPLGADDAVRVQLQAGGQGFGLHAGGVPQGPGWDLRFEKALASPSQPFVLRVEGRLAWWQWPWGRVLAWWLAVALAGLATRAWRRQAEARRRAEALVRLGQVARLNTLGELAAGMAHELNNPLAAVLANVQAAQRLLDEDPPDGTQARQAMAQAVQQARRASEVLGRLRTQVERPDAAGARAPVAMLATTRAVLALLAPEIGRLGVQVHLSGDECTAWADRVAVEQVLHNLLRNALAALEQVPAGQRRLVLALRRLDHQVELSVRDSGPGIPAALLPRLFEPFVSGRPGGLGLGLSLCETLVGAMGGQLSGRNLERGAEFVCRLPLPAA